MTRPRRAATRLPVILKIAVTVVALWFVLWNASPSRVAEIVIHADPVWLAVVASAALLQLLGGAWRWQLVHRQVAGRLLPYGAMLRGFCRSLLFGQLLPSSVGSDAIRAMALARETGLVAAVRSVVCDRLLGLLTLLAIVAATLPLFGALIADGKAFASLAIASLGGLGLMLLLMCCAGRLIRIKRITGLAAYAGGDLRDIVFSSSGAAPVGLAFVSHVLSVLMFAAAVCSVGDETPPLRVLLIVPPAMLVSSLPISLGGWGVREAAIAYACGWVGTIPAAAVSASIIFGLSSPAVSAVIELAAVLFHRNSAKPGKAASGAA